MTSVNITTQKNTVTVNGETSVVTVATQGPQGPISQSLDITNAVDNSILYFDASNGTLIADATTTKLTLVNGGNF